jgi:hypothetical protein
VLVPYKEGGDTGRSRQSGLPHRLAFSFDLIIHQIKMISTNIVIFMIYVDFSHGQAQARTA